MHNVMAGSEESDVIDHLFFSAFPVIWPTFNLLSFVFLFNVSPYYSLFFSNFLKIRSTLALHAGGDPHIRPGHSLSQISLAPKVLEPFWRVLNSYYHRFLPENPHVNRNVSRCGQLSQVWHKHI
jgi:hypothetical protein